MTRGARSRRRCAGCSPGARRGEEDRARHGCPAPARERGRERVEDRVLGGRIEHRPGIDLDVRDAGGKAGRGVPDERARVEAVEDGERAVAGGVVALARRAAVVAAEQGARRGALHAPVEQAAVVALAAAPAVGVLERAEGRATVAGPCGCRRRTLASRSTMPSPHPLDCTRRAAVAARCCRRRTPRRDRRGRCRSGSSRSDRSGRRGRRREGRRRRRATDRWRRRGPRRHRPRRDRGVRRRNSGRRWCRTRGSPAGSAACHCAGKSRRRDRRRHRPRRDRAARCRTPPARGPGSGSQIEPAIRRAADRPAGVLERFARDAGRHRAVALLARIDDAVAAAWRVHRYAPGGVQLACVGAPDVPAHVVETLACLAPEVLDHSSRRRATGPARTVRHTTAGARRGSAQLPAASQLDRSRQRVAVVLEDTDDPAARAGPDNAGAAP